MSVSNEPGLLTPDSIAVSAPKAAASGIVLCVKCLESGTETLATTKRWDEDVCASCDDRANEAAYERSLEDFYGGASDCTDRERMASADRLNREGRY